ncbi:MAG: sigma-70 family RNA polymerase sigma factor [Planctomycetota bacterium]|nr:sigma-70 family RNA polymerase sigma factor [Planctomycetota bacterium]
MVTLPQTAGGSVRLPLHLGALQRLRQRGVLLEPRSGESSDEHAARLETELMLAFRETGASDDFEALYDHARGPLLLWITALAAGRRAGLEAPELLQDTFVNVYRYAQSFRDHGPRSFRVWSRTIAGNLVRRTRCERRRSLQDMPEGLQEPPDRRAGPAAELFEAEDERILQRAWFLLLSRYLAAYEQLSERDRAALHLVEVEGHSYQDACKRLHVGLSNLKMILFRARRRIRAAISADFGVPLPRETPVRPVRLMRAG